MNAHSLLIWAEKSCVLRARYQSQQKDLVTELMRSMGLKRKFPWNRIRQVQDIVSAMQNIIGRRQMPLFNNIVNYGNLAVGMVNPTMKDPQESVKVNTLREMLVSYVRDADLIRKNLQQQLQILQTSPLQVQEYLELWKQEQVLVGQMKNNAQQVKNDVLIILQDNIRKSMTKAESKATDTFLSIQEKKQAFYAIENLAIVASVVCLMIGADTGELLTNVRKVAQLLQAA